MRGSGRVTGRQGDRWLLAAAAAMLGLALVAPTVPIERRLFDQIIVFDVTQSMNVEDMNLEGRPASRLDAARQAVREALVRLPCGSRLGFGAFTEHRTLLLLAPVEVCEHRRELRDTLEAIDGRIAWTGNSEVAKGLYSALRIAAQVPGKPSLVFVTDGHEAPPVNPRYRPRFDGQVGEIDGLLVGVGGLRPQPIPKRDPSGRPLGFWDANEVLQVDPRSLGRAGSMGGEQLVDEGGGPAAPLPGATPGSEHLSALREAYLRLLADETRLVFHRLDGVDALSDALTSDSFVHPVVARTSLSPLFAALALPLLLLRHRAALGRLREAVRRPGGPKPTGRTGRAHRRVQSAASGMRKTGSL